MVASAGSRGEISTPPPQDIPVTRPPLSALLMNDAGLEITNAAAWFQQRESFKKQWLDYLGRPLETSAPLKTEVLETEEFPEFTRQRVRYQIEEGLYTEAYLLTPKGPAGRLPAVVVFHQTIDSHIRQAAGVDTSDPELMQGEQLVRRGYLVLCPRCFIFDEGADYAGQVTAMQVRHPEWTGMARMVWDARRAADFLVSLPRVDPERIGCMGHSLGAKEVLYAAAFDDRYKASVFNEGGVGLDFSNWDAPWYLGPGIRKTGFHLEHHQLLALVAPRSFLLIAGDSADGDRSRAFIEAALPVFHLLDVPDHLEWLNHHQGHRYPPAARKVAEEFLDLHLKNPAQAPGETIQP